MKKFALLTVIVMTLAFVAAPTPAHAAPITLYYYTGDCQSNPYPQVGPMSMAGLWENTGNTVAYNNATANGTPVHGGPNVNQIRGWNCLSISTASNVWSGTLCVCSQTFAADSVLHGTYPPLQVTSYPWTLEPAVCD